MDTLDLYNTPENASPFDQLRQVRADGTEFWSARDLMPVLGYGMKWENFAQAIDRAKATALNTGLDLQENFPDARKVTGARGPASQDVELSRYAAYLVAMNGDPRKPEIAAAQSYFAVRTRQAETVKPAVALTGPALMAAALIEAAKTIEETQAQLTTVKAELETVTPKAQAFDVFINANGDYSVNEAAKVLSRDPNIDIGEGKLFKLLDQWKLIYREGRRNAPRVYQSQLTAGRFTEKARPPYLDTRTGEWQNAHPQVRITAKGLDYLHARLTAATTA